MPPCETCTNEQRILALEEDKNRNSEQHKEFYGQLKDLAIDGGRKEERENARDRQLTTMMQMISELKASVTEIQNRPIQQVNKVWDNLIGKGVDFIVIAVVGYIVYMLK